MIVNQLVFLQWQAIVRLRFMFTIKFLRLSTIKTSWSYDYDKVDGEGSWGGGRGVLGGVNDYSDSQTVDCWL